MTEEPRPAAIARESGTPRRSPFHAVDLDDVGAAISPHLQQALDDGVDLVVTVGGHPQIAVETVEDLEVLHDVLRQRSQRGDGR